MAELDKVCEHINLPVQAGDDQVLTNMRRRYTEREYRDLIDTVRSTVPHVSLGTDVIVGFPGETREQYQRTLDLVEDIQFNKVHVAAYSPRPGTIAHRRIPDDVPQEERNYRLKNLDAVQEGILSRNTHSFWARRWRSWWKASARANGRAAPGATSSSSSRTRPITLAN